MKQSGGQIIFITGGNGSGKSTLAKLITGLYPSQEGYIAINGNVIEAGSAGEYFFPQYFLIFIYLTASMILITKGSRMKLTVT
ncbi:ATP-binding cassette domain-containing protein [Paenibacillus rhizoplanae]